uniref:Uncharacterized protein n=1 Tax=Romanomermis culicivorax TaxID=13658 RepID=A0A915HLW7_ROMCU
MVSVAPPSSILAFVSVLSGEGLFETSPLTRFCRPILRIGRLVNIRGDLERRVVDFAAYVYFVLLFHVANGLLRAGSDLILSMLGSSSMSRRTALARPYRATLRRPMQVPKENSDKKTNYQTANRL